MSVHDPHGIPWSELLIPQILNFSLFFGLLIFFLRKPVSTAIAQKNLDYEEQKKSAEAQRKVAEKENFEARNKLRNLEEGASQSLLNAKQEAQQMKDVAIKNAKASAQKTTADASQMAEFEKMRAIVALKQEFVQNALIKARSDLDKQLSDQKQNALNSQFVNKIVAGAK